MGCAHTLKSETPQLTSGWITTDIRLPVLSVAEDAPLYSVPIPRHGEVVRLAMALIEGARVTSADRTSACEELKSFCANANGVANGDEIPVLADEELGARLMALARQSDRHLSTQLELLVRFADAELYLKDGCRSMVQWMDVYLGMGRIAASEHLRVGRALRELPMCGALFALGTLSYTKARIITRHATPATDETLATATLDMSSSETENWCARYRHEQDLEAVAAAEDKEATAALIAHDRRALRSRQISPFCTRITLDLPTDTAAEFLRSLEHCDDEVREDEVRGDEVRGDERNHAGDSQKSSPSEANSPTASPTTAPTTAPTAVQRRADAAVLMSRRSLAHAGEAVSMADRYRVHVTVDSAVLANLATTDSAAPAPCAHHPKKKPLLEGTTPVSPATVRRLAELAGYTAYAVDDDGDPVASKHTAPPFTRRQLRALRARDGYCQMPGCGATRHLDGHHVVPRSEGGHSSFDNAALLCGGCHRLLHEGGFRLERVPNTESDQPADATRRYRLLGADGLEYGSRGAALRRAGADDIGEELFPQGNDEENTAG